MFCDAFLCFELDQCPFLCDALTFPHKIHTILDKLETYCAHISESSTVVDTSSNIYELVEIDTISIKVATLTLRSKVMVTNYNGRILIKTVKYYMEDYVKKWPFQKPEVTTLGGHNLWPLDHKPKVMDY